MKIKVLEKNNEKMRFILEGVSTGFANALRRIMVSGVPTMSVDTVEFQENEGALFDEMLAHRIGLVPIKFEPDKFNLVDECTCEGEGCPLCQVVFVIDKKGPCTVLSGDMKSTNKEVVPLYDNIPITELDKGQILKCEAVAHLGFGKKHAKNQASVAVCQNYPDIKISGGVDNKKVVSAFPKGILKLSGAKIQIEDPFRVEEFRDSVEQFKGKVKVDMLSDKFLFTVETACGLEPQDIVKEAAKELQKKSEEFKKKLSDI